jgi:hypothetical protein
MKQKGLPGFGFLFGPRPLRKQVKAHTVHVDIWWVTTDVIRVLVANERFSNGSTASKLT